MKEKQAARLREARTDAKYLTAEAACASFGWSVGTYRHHENATRGFDVETAVKYARAFKVNAGWLLALDGYKSAAELKAAQQVPAPVESAVFNPANDDETVEVRRVDLSYGMGPGTNLDDYPDEGTMRFDLGWLRAVTRAHSDMLFVARGDGDSMSPTLINDDTVLIDTSQRILNLQDRIWAVSVYGAGMIKRLRAIGEGRVKVLSDNPTVPEQDVAVEDLHIVGRVVWVGRRI